MKLIAHRLPDSEVAVRALQAAGANLFELDVQQWRGSLVVSHFLPVIRPFSRWRRDRMRFLWVREMHGLPFEEAVRQVPDGAGLVLDLKTDRGRGAWLLAERVASQEADRRRCVVASKHWGSLAQLGERGYPAWRSVATRTALRTLLDAGPDPRFTGVSIRHTFLTPSLVERLRGFGDVVAWTVPTPSRAQALTAWGVTGITADSPAVLAAPAAVPAHEADPP